MEKLKEMGGKLDPDWELEPNLNLYTGAEDSYDGDPNIDFNAASDKEIKKKAS